VLTFGPASALAEMSLMLDLEAYATSAAVVQKAGEMLK
jgi:hypothetical protein